jgi:hypothetical protein
MDEEPKVASPHARATEIERIVSMVPKEPQNLAKA